MSLIKKYFNEHLEADLLGDLTTYTTEHRIIEHMVDGYMVRYNISWWDREGDKPQLLEINMTIRGLANRGFHKKAWIYRNEEGGWSINEFKSPL